MADIFISYAKKDLTRVEPLAKALEEQGWSVWWDRAIPPGKRFAEIIKEAIDEAKCVLVLWSYKSIKSEWVQEEAAIGKRRQILVPAKIDPVEPPLGFGLIQAADLTDWKAESIHSGFSILLNAISEAVGHPSLKVKKAAQTYRAGFIVRPFEREFNDIEEYIKSFFNRHRIKVQHYVSTPGRPIVSEELQKEIRSSHFGIIDITGLNENVMIELGMLMALERKVLLLRRYDDQTDESDEMKLPFDLQGRHIYRYQMDPSSPGTDGKTFEINIINPADGQATKLADILHDFIAELQSDRSFEDANPWEDGLA